MRLYRLLLELGSLGREEFKGGVLEPLPFPFPAGRCGLDLEGFEERGTSGDCLSRDELRVDEDLLGSGSSAPSWLRLFPELSAVLNEALERRRMLRSRRNEGITAGRDHDGDDDGGGGGASFWLGGWLRQWLGEVQE